MLTVTAFHKGQLERLDRHMLCYDVVTNSQCSDCIKDHNHSHNAAKQGGELENRGDRILRGVSQNAACMLTTMHHSTAEELIAA